MTTEVGTLVKVIGFGQLPMLAIAQGAQALLIASMGLGNNPVSREKVDEATGKSPKVSIWHVLSPIKLKTFFTT
jgi:hypothetical protein